MGESYVVELLTKLDVLFCSIDTSSGKSILVVILLFLDFYSIAYLLAAIFNGKSTAFATPLFWLVLGFLSFGFLMPIFWILEFVGVKLLGIPRNQSDENYILNFVIPTLVALLVALILDGEHMEFALLAGMITIPISMVVHVCINNHRTLVLKNELDENEKYVYQYVFANKKIKKEILDSKRVDIKVKINEIEYVFHRVSKKSLRDWFLGREKVQRGYVEKTYVKLNDTIDVVEIGSTNYRVVYSSMAGFMLLIMVCTPSLLYVVNRLIEFIK